jgi:hypothetical protein
VQKQSANSDAPVSAQIPLKFVQNSTANTVANEQLLSNSVIKNSVPSNDPNFIMKTPVSSRLFVTTPAANKTIKTEVSSDVSPSTSTKNLIQTGQCNPKPQIITLGNAMKHHLSILFFYR